MGDGSMGPNLPTRKVVVPLLFPAHLPYSKQRHEITFYSLALPSPSPLFKQYHKFAFIPLALPQPISIIRGSNMNSLLFPCSSSVHLHYSEQLHEFAFIPFLFPAYLPYSSAALAHSLNSLLVGSCSPAHDCRWKQLSLRMDHSTIAAFGT